MIAVDVTFGQTLSVVISWFLGDNSRVMRVFHLLCLVTTTCLSILLRTEADEPMLGTCNMTHFTSGGQLCQRIMITNLKNKINANCSLEYHQQTSCLTSHVSSCLSGIFAGVVPAVTSLLKLIFYHCGDLKVDPALMNQFLLDQIKCKSEVFTKTVQCWDDFRARLNNNKSDPQLCRDYALSKECVALEAKTGCAIGQYINRDLYNPFCPNTTDPAISRTRSNSTVAIGRCSSQNFAKSLYKCQRDMITSLAGDNSLSCRQEYTGFEFCVSVTLTMCLSDTSLSPFSDDIHRLVLAVLYHCGDLTADNLQVNSFIADALNCKADMFETAVQCWDEFRLRLILNKFDMQLCQDYARAKQCVLTSVQRGCAIGDLIEEDPYNPFCTDGMDSLSFPPSSVPLSQRFTFTCENRALYKMGIVCERTFLDAILLGHVGTNCSSEAMKFLACFQASFESCIGPTSNPVLLRALAILVGQILPGLHLLCEYPTKTLGLEDLPPILDAVASCDNGYTTEASKCGSTFRSRFVSVPSSLCQDYEDAKTCIDLARRSHCSFSFETLKTLKGNYNPFCDNRTRPLFSHGSSALLNVDCVILVSSLLVCLKFILCTYTHISR